MRVSGGCVSLAFAAALVLHVWKDRRVLSRREWLAAAALIPISAWGQIATTAYHGYRFIDPFIYAHAHAQFFKHQPHLWHVFLPEANWMLASVRQSPHEFLVAAVMGLWFALGHRGLARFSAPGRTYLYVQFLSTLAVSFYGSAELHYAGLTRYTLVMFGGFFAMASVLKRRPIALLMWIGLSSYHYWTADLPLFLSHGEPDHMHDGEMDRPTWPRD